MQHAQSFFWVDIENGKKVVRASTSHWKNKSEKIHFPHRLTLVFGRKEKPVNL